MLAPAATVALLGFLTWTYLNAHHAHNTGIVPPFVPILAIAAVAAVGWLLREKLEGWAFVANAVALVGLVATIFLNLYPRVMVSSISPALQPDHRQLVLGAVHAQGDDHRRPDLHAAGARLPGLVLLGLPGPGASPG